VNGIDCSSAGNCLVAGENGTQEGIMSTLTDGKAGTTQNVTGTASGLNVAANLWFGRGNELSARAGLR
jgi:hypothetical protein